MFAIDEPKAFLENFVSEGIRRYLVRLAECAARQNSRSPTQCVRGAHV